jgi:ribosomal-protein-alanine N-acetyltransferase
MQPPRHIETERLVLRSPRVTDADAIFRRWASDPNVPRYMTWTPHASSSETLGFIERCLQDADTNRGFHWMLTERGGDDEPIGAISVSRDNAFCVHVGYVLERARWGQGLIVEAAQPILEWVKTQPEIYRCYAVCDVENRASARVLEKLKLRYEGILRRAILHPNASHEPSDVHMFSWTR